MLKKHYAQALDLSPGFVTEDDRLFMLPER